MVVWTTLCLLSGVALARLVLLKNVENNTARNACLGLSVLVFAMSSAWQYVYHRDHPEAKRQAIGVFIILLMTATPLVLATYRVSTLSATLLSPLLVWCTVQMGIAASELECLTGPTPV